MGCLMIDSLEPNSSFQFFGRAAQCRRNRLLNLRIVPLTGIGDKSNCYDNRIFIGK